jgi:hypothetical protein
MTVQANQTSTATPSSTASASDTAVPLASNSNSKTTNVAVIAGGAIGGVAGLLGLSALACFCFRRRRRRHVQSSDGRPSPLLAPGPGPRFTNDPFASTAPTSMSLATGELRPLRSRGESDASISNPAVPDPTTSYPMMNLTPLRAAANGNTNSVLFTPTTAMMSSVGGDSPNLGNTLTINASPITDAAAAGVPQDSSSPAIRPLPVPGSLGNPNEKMRQPSLHSLSSASTPERGVPSAQANPVLTDVQADFVNSLFTNNVPGPVVARVLERMLANPQAVGGIGANDPELRAAMGAGISPDMSTQARAGVLAWLQGASEIGDGETTIGTAPPSYDFVRAQS